MGVNPAQAQSFRADGSRAMSPTSAMTVMAVSRPIPRHALEGFDPRVVRGAGEDLRFQSRDGNGQRVNQRQAVAPRFCA
jgi:hypothetical protein